MKIFGYSLVKQELVSKYVFIYRTSHLVSWRFTIHLLGEIGRQLVKAPLAVIKIKLIFLRLTGK